MRVKTFIMATSAAGALALSAGAASADPNGWYGAVDIGYHTLNGATARGDVELDLNTEGDWAGFARLGYRFTPAWRVELEGGYRDNNQFDEIDNPGAGLPAGICNFVPPTGPCLPPEGEVSAATLMVNVLYDFGPEDAALRPFIGLGAGGARVSTAFIGTSDGNRSLGITADDYSIELAAQAIAGLAWQIGDRASIDLTYRYLMTDFEFETAVGNVAGGGPPRPPLVTTNNPGPFVGEYENSHTVSLGLRYSFGAVDEPLPPPPPPVAPTPPPPPPVAPAPRPAVPPAREFVVYFDWDRSDLTAEASSVVTQAANYAKSGRPTRVLVVGHADTSGSAEYNIGLSNRRARTVADALVSQGVNGGVISLDGRGETQLARQTADGVREPLNRRATIGINF